MIHIKFPATIRTSAGEILPGQSISQTLKAQSPDLRQILISSYTYDRVNTCSLNIRLEEVQTASLIAEKQFNCSELKDDTPINFSFAPQPASKDRDYRLIFSSSDSKPGQAVSIVYLPGLHYPAGQLTFGGKVQKGGLDFDFFESITANFTNQGKADYRRVYKYKASLGRYYTLSQADIALSDEIARQKLDGLDFDPYKSVVLSLPAAPSGGLHTISSTEPAATSQVISEEAESVRLKTNLLLATDPI